MTRWLKAVCAVSARISHHTPMHGSIHSHTKHTEHVSSGTTSPPCHPTHATHVVTAGRPLLVGGPTHALQHVVRGRGDAPHVATSAVHRTAAGFRHSHGSSVVGGDRDFPHLVTQCCATQQGAVPRAVGTRQAIGEAAFSATTQVRRSRQATKGPHTAADVHLTEGVCFKPIRQHHTPQVQRLAVTQPHRHSHMIHETSRRVHSTPPSSTPNNAPRPGELATSWQHRGLPRCHYHPRHHCHHCQGPRIAAPRPASHLAPWSVPSCAPLGTPPHTGEWLPPAAGGHDAWVWRRRVRNQH